MSKLLRDSAERDFSKALQFIQKGRYKEALVKLQKAEEAAQKAKVNDILLRILTNKGRLMLTLGEYEESLKIHSISLKIAEELLITNSKSDLYQQIFQMNLDAIDNLGIIFYKKGHFPQAKNCFEFYIYVSHKLIENDPENVIYHSNLGTMFNNLGGLFLAMGRLEDSKSSLKNALHIKQKLLENDPENTFYQLDVAYALSNLGALFYDEGRHEDSKDNYERALDIYDIHLKNDPDNEAYQSVYGGILNNLGNLLRIMGQYEDSIVRLENALYIKQKLFKNNPDNKDYQSDVAMTLNNLGTLLRKMGRYEDSKDSFENSLDLKQKLLENDPSNVTNQSDVAMILNNLGNLLRNMGRYEDSKDRFENSLDLKQKLLENDPENNVYQSDIAMAFNDFGNLFLAMGRFEEAKQKYEKAIEMREELFKKDPKNEGYQSDIGGTYGNLAYLLKEMGRVEESIQMFEKVLEIDEDLLNKDSKNVVYQSAIGRTLSNIANLLMEMGRFEESMQWFEKALEIDEDLLTKDPKNEGYQSAIGGTFNDLGNLLMEMGRFEESKQWFEKALQNDEDLLKNDPENLNYLLKIGGVQNNLGVLLLNMGLLIEAKRKCERALEIREELFKIDPENVNYKLGVGGALYNLGNSLYSQGCYSSALDLYLRALNDYAIDSNNINLLFRVYASIGRCYEKLGNYESAFANYKESVECIESTRSLYSLEEIKMDMMWDKGEPYTEIISLLCKRMNESGKAWEYVSRFKSRTLLNSLRFLKIEAPENLPSELLLHEENLLASIKTFEIIRRKAEKADNVAQLTREIKEKESELKVIYDQIREFSSEYVDLRNGQPLGINEIKDLIGNQKEKTAFVEYYTTDDKVYIFVMRSDKRISKVKIVELTKKSLSKYVLKYFDEIVIRKGKYGEMWNKLSEYLVEPIFRYIKTCKLVYLVPHGLLHYLPIHALFVENKRLIEHFPIVYTPSLTALKYSQSNTARKLESCLSLGYTPNENEKEIFEGEAELVAELFNVHPKLGLEATSSILRKSNSDLIHVSCHGGFDWQNPLNSGLTLADKNLSLDEIYDLDLNTGLLVLSACETGLNKQKPGDELVGLTRGFLHAGAESLIVSLWSVMADSTLEFMSSFYMKIKEENVNKAEALQKTQVEFIYNEKYSNPYLWASFILIGNWK